MTTMMNQKSVNKIKCNSNFVDFLREVSLSLLLILRSFDACSFWLLYIPPLYLSLHRALVWFFFLKIMLDRYLSHTHTHITRSVYEIRIMPFYPSSSHFILFFAINSHLLRLKVLFSLLFPLLLFRLLRLYCGFWANPSISTIWVIFLSLSIFFPISVSLSSFVHFSFCAPLHYQFFVEPLVHRPLKFRVNNT